MSDKATDTAAASNGRASTMEDDVRDIYRELSSDDPVEHQEDTLEAVTDEPTGGEDTTETVEDKPAAEAQEDEPAADDEDTAEDEPVEAEAAADSDDDEADAPAALEAPEHWPEDHKEVFNLCPDEIKPFFLAKTKEMEKGYQGKFDELAEQRKTYEANQQLSSALEGYQQDIQLSGMSEAQYVQRLAAIERQIRQNPREGVLNLARSLGVDLTPSAAPTHDVEGQADEEWQDPAVTALRQQVDALTQQQIATQNATIQASQTQLAARIDEFRTGKDADGNSLRPHIDNPGVQHRSVAYLRSLGTPNPSIPQLQEAYLMAVAGDPSLVTAAPATPAADTTSDGAAKAILKARRNLIEKAKRVHKPVETHTSAPSDASELAPEGETIDQSVRRSLQLLQSNTTI